MNREILFRGKRNHTGEWVYGDLIIDGIDFEYAIREHGDSGCGTVFAVDEKTVGQYTGITDKNGNKVFEGDVVRWADFTMEIFWGSDIGVGYGFCWKPCGSNQRYHESMTGFIDEYEVIGNIFDNKELLK